MHIDNVHQYELRMCLPQVVSDVRPSCTPRAQLDARQYTRERILRYERAYGPGFVSTGGLDSTRELVNKLGLQPDQRVLDVGCGVGGSAMYMARDCGVYVHAIDLSMNMVLCALERANTLLDSNVSFEIADVSTKDFSRHTFDFVFSKDALQHIQDKESLLAKYAVPPWVVWKIECTPPANCCCFAHQKTRQKSVFCYCDSAHTRCVFQDSHVAPPWWHPPHCRPLPCSNPPLGGL